MYNFWGILLAFAIVIDAARWSAVVRGAVIHGIETKGIVEARKLKRHYGVVLGTPFDPSIHEEEDSFFDIFTMMKMTMDNVEWLAGKAGCSGEGFGLLLQ